MTGRLPTKHFDGTQVREQGQSEPAPDLTPEESLEGMGEDLSIRAEAGDTLSSLQRKKRGK